MRLIKKFVPRRTKAKKQIVHYNRLKPFKARSENDDQPLRRSTQIADRQPNQRYDEDHFPSTDDEDDSLLQRNRRIHRRIREPVYDMWDDDNNGGDIQDISAEPTQILVPMPKINVDGQEPAANEIEPEQEALIDATAEQPVIAADEPNNIDDDEQRRYPRRTRRQVDKFGL